MFDPIYLIMFVFGAAFGSFLNVVIYRVPLRMSIIAPRSHCFSCKTPIRFKDNIPILGYLFLGGKCRDCGVSYSSRYPLVEFLTGLGGIIFIYFNDLLLIDWQDGATGALIFGGFLFIIGVLGEFILRKESIGLGDVKLGLVLGGILGAKFSIVALYLSFACAALSIMILMGLKKINTSNKIPFGPYLSLGTFFTLMTSTSSGENAIVNWYFRTMF